MSLFLYSRSPLVENSNTNEQNINLKTIDKHSFLVLYETINLGAIIYKIALGHKVSQI